MIKGEASLRGDKIFVLLSLSYKQGSVDNWTTFGTFYCTKEEYELLRQQIQWSYLLGPSNMDLYGFPSHEDLIDKAYETELESRYAAQEETDEQS